MVLLVLMHCDLIELVQGCKKVDGTENHLPNFYSEILGIYTASQLKITESRMILWSRSCPELNANRNPVVSRIKNPFCTSRYILLLDRFYNSITIPDVLTEQLRY